MVSIADCIPLHICSRSKGSIPEHTPTIVLSTIRSTSKYPMKPSPTTVLLLFTNLRLLDYNNDSEGSCPITPDIFTSLQNKGKAFEHIVYHLLKTLDPQECAIRLEGCWPIYEPAQSRELRNVVFKWLTDLKKSGQMGGNILVRRTLLDDCSGERYEELLLSLSTTVLRNQIEKGNFQDANRDTFAYKQTYSLAPSSGTLRALVLAHQSSITRLLFTRRLSKSQWSSFNSFLNTKEALMSETLSQLATNESPEALPRGYEDEVSRKWRNNWLGDQRWLDILLRGDPEHMRDRFFELPFEKALAKHHHFKNGLLGTVNGEVSLRALEKQVQEQKSRLGELQQMKQEALRAGPSFAITILPKTGTNMETQLEEKDLRVVFDQHQHLHIGQLQINKYMANQKNEYTELLNSLRDDLAAAGIPSNRESSAPSEYIAKTSSPTGIRGLDFTENATEIDFIDIDPMEIDEDDKLSEPKLPVSEYLRYDYESNQEINKPSSPLRELSSTPIVRVSQKIGGNNPLPTTARDGSYLGGDEEFSALRGSMIKLDPLLHNRGKSLAFGDDERLAEQIVSTISATGFSPEKPSPAKPVQHQQYKEPLDFAFDIDENSLRLSIYQQTTQYSQSESSSFLSGQGLSTALRQPSSDGTRKEDLLVSSDYDSVFKSRPKIAVSPPFAPVGGSVNMLPDLSLVSGIQTPDCVFSNDMADFSTKHASSPLTRKDGKRVKM